MSKGKKKKKRQQKALHRAAQQEIQAKKHEKEQEEKKRKASFFVDKTGHVSRSMKKTFSKERVAELTGTTAEKLVAHQTKRLQQTQLIKPKKNVIKRKRKKKAETTSEPSGSKKKKAKHALDIWATPSPTGKIEITSNNFSIEVDDLKNRVFKHNKEAAERDILKDGTQIAHPGASFNPSTEDHKAAVHNALEHHRAEMKEINETNNTIRKMQKFAAKQSWRKKTTDDGKENEDESSSSEDERNDQSSSNKKRPPVRAEDRKTRVQRNKEKRRRAAERIVAKKQRLKRRRKEMQEFSKIVKTFENEEQEKVKKREELAKMRAEKNEPPRLGKLKFTPAFPAVQESNEQTSTLRNIKPNQALFESMAKNFERKNMLEPRKKAKRRKPKFKPKFYTRKNHKERVY